MIIKRQRHVVLKQKTKIHTELHCFALKLCLNSTNKERNCNKEVVETSFSSEINKQGGTLIRYLRVFDYTSFIRCM